MTLNRNNTYIHTGYHNLKNCKVECAPRAINIKRAFTLAEVLITLGIIGIVAQMTIPTLMQNVQEKSYVTSLKKAYSTFSQAYTMAVNDNGTPDNWGLSPQMTSAGSISILNNMAPFLKIAQNCGTSAGCFPNSDYLFLDKSSTEGIDSINWKTKIKLQDGTSVSFFSRSADCNASSGTSLALQNICGAIEIDINGLKRPNQFGIDLFRFHITKYGIVPYGTSQEIVGHVGMTLAFNDSCRKESPGRGEGCAAWVIYNENEDYTKCSGLSWDGKSKCD